MKITRKKRSPKVMIVAGAVVIIMVVSSLVYVYCLNGNLFGWKSAQSSNDNGQINYSPTTSEQKQAGNQSKTGSTDTPPSPTPIPGSTKKNVQITINSSRNGSELHIGVLIGAVEDGGACTLTLTSPGQPQIIKTASTQALASISTCQGFDVTVTDGAWHVLVEYNSNSLTGSATTDIK